MLPAKWGFALYHAIQKRFTGSFKSKLDANEKSFQTIYRICANNAVEIAEKSVLEIGSGWMPLMPYLLKFRAEVHRIYTYDINFHYQNKYIDELNAHFEREGIQIKKSQKGLHLPDFVEYHPYQNVIHAKLPENIDLIFSRFVLEHVTPTDIVAMHHHFREAFNDGVYVLHLISPSDHRAFGDATISHYDFLRYSQDEWNRIQTKFDYHNRLRLPQYLKLFEEAGMEVVYVEHDIAEPGSKKHELFKKLTIHPDFAQFSDVELTAGAINILLRAKPIKQ